MNKPDADIDRYRALLRDAHDEPKRLALIRLIVADGARDKLAAECRPDETELTLQQSLPFELPRSPEPSPPHSTPQPDSFNEPSTEPELKNAGHLDVGQVQQSLPAAPCEAVTASAIAPALSNSSSADDLAQSIAKILGSPGRADAVPAAANSSSSGAPPSGNDVESSIAALIRAVLENCDRR